MMQPGPQSGNFMMQQWFATGSLPGLGSVGFRLFFNGALDIDFIEPNGLVTTALVPVGGLQVVVATARQMFVTPNTEISFPYGGNNVVTMRFDRATNCITLTLTDITTRTMLSEVSLPSGETLTILSEISASSVHYDNSSAAPAGTFQG